MKKIRRVNITDAATYYDEKVEKIVMYPQVNKIEVYTYREFYNSNDEVMRTENGVDLVDGTRDLSSFEDLAIQFVNKKRRR